MQRRTALIVTEDLPHYQVRSTCSLLCFSVPLAARKAVFVVEKRDDFRLPEPQLGRPVVVLLGDGREGAGPCGKLPGPRVGKIGMLLGGDRRGGAGPGEHYPSLESVNLWRCAHAL